MARVIFHNLAEREYRSARQWYADRSIETALRFRDSVDAALKRVLTDPDAISFWKKGPSQVIRIRKYPYVIIFRQIDASIIKVLALAHTSRRPGYWRHRT